MTETWLRPALRNTVCLLVATAFALLPPSAALVRAELITTETVLQGATRPHDARARVRALLAREDVAAELGRFGLTPEQAQGRLAALSDAEVARIAGRIDELPAGGSFGEVVLIVAVVVVVLAITDYLGITTLFPWIEPREQPSQL